MVVGSIPTPGAKQYAHAIIVSMNSKSLIWIFMAIGSTAGSYIPSLWGAGFLSFSSIVLGAFGGAAGIWLGFKLNN